MSLDTNTLSTIPFIKLEKAAALMPDAPFGKPIDWQINEGEAWAVVGNNGSGKSLLAEMLAGRYALKEGRIEYCFLSKMKEQNNSLGGVLPRSYIKTVHFNGVYSFNGFREIYYQQRYNSTESDEIPFVGSLFTSGRELEVINLLGIQKLLGRRLNQLSSGELRKLLVAKALVDSPRMLIVDNPFTGLDAASRVQLNDIFAQLHTLGIQLVFLVPSKEDIPAAASHVLEMNQGAAVRHAGRSSFLNRKEHAGRSSFTEIDWTRFPGSMPSDYQEAARLVDIDIAYGSTVINKGINWTIRRGERWALCGPNGSGKSTLLSYIFADNPQAYAKNIWLFGRRRGSGESIWDIKKRIGFTSSEMHLYYRRNAACLSVAASGFFDSIGLYRTCSESQLQLAGYLFDVFSISHLKDRSFLKISSGEQRLILFMRALIKNPDLLILDEPLHGLDSGRKRFCTQVIESFCRQPGKTLIYVTHRKEELPPCVDKQLDL